MSDVKLAANQVTELPVSSMALEKSLQTLIENHLDTFLVVAFLAPRTQTARKPADGWGIFHSPFRVSHPTFHSLRRSSFFATYFAKASKVKKATKDR